tara:strand:+ start:15818 stop:16846 length:1029 start_codon:yes stop_codon:yes gene_type:complete
MIENIKKDNIFGTSSRIFGFLFVYYAFAGNIIPQTAVLLFFMFLFFGSIIKNLKISFTVLEIIFFLVLLINIFLAIMAPEKTSKYILSQMIFLLIAGIGIKIEKNLFSKKSQISQLSVWTLGLFLLLIYVLTFFSNQFLWIFESLFMTNDAAISSYSGGALRFYSIAAVSFLIIPVNGYRKFFSFFINLIPLSPINAIAWFFIHFKIKKVLIFLSIFTSFFILAIFIFDNLMSNVLTIFDFLNDKLLGLESRQDKLSNANLIGANSNFNDDFSETFWIALAQSNGVLISAISFFIFFSLIIKLSKNFFFVTLSLMLTIVNPFPLAIIYLLAESWKKENHRNE